MTSTELTTYSNSKCSNYEKINTCVQCDEGYYFNITNDQCLSCDTDSNCAYCDFKDPSRCIMCKSTFFMTVQPNNSCISNSVLDVAETVVEEIIPDIYIDSGLGVFRIWGISFTLIFVLEKWL